MLDRKLYPDTAAWVGEAERWLPSTPDGSDHWGFAQHVAEFRRAMTDRLDLGHPPKDLFEILAIVALAGPGVCAHRALRRVANLDPAHPELLSGAARVAQGLRTTFNMPESTALVRALASDRRTRYWELVLRHALAGNLQAVLDEYAHVLEESLGLMGHPDVDVVSGIAGEMLEALSIRTSQIRMDNIRCTGSGVPIEVDPFNIRSRFALRFGDLQGRTGGERSTRRRGKEGVQLSLPAVHSRIDLDRPGRIGLPHLLPCRLSLESSAQSRRSGAERRPSASLQGTRCAQERG